MNIAGGKSVPGEMENPFILAPMAGVTDLPFRFQLCKNREHARVPLSREGVVEVVLFRENAFVALR